ncbi:MAG: VOC family protein [Rhizobiaceae bacterium]|nr:VOC family protein [Rhizobiaceae bacterium]
MRLSLVALVVPDYDVAIAFYCGALGFALLEDTQISPTKRWVRVAPRDKAGRPGETGFLLARADSEAQAAAIGNQTGGRVSFFITSDDFAADYARLCANGVRFAEEPRHESYGTVAVFTDPFGNRFDLIQLSKQPLG